jgi:hypothetical protein
MSPTDAIPAAADPIPDPRAMIARQLARLERLAEIGMAISEEAPAAADPDLAFARVSRALRLTFALQSRLMADLADLDKAGVEAAKDARAERRVRIQRQVERALEAKTDDAVAIRAIAHDLRERLRDDDDFGALLDGPVEDAVAFICREFRLPPPRPPRTGRRRLSIAHPRASGDPDPSRGPIQLSPRPPPPPE